MVTNRKEHSSETRTKQAENEDHSQPNKIGASTPYDFAAKNLTPYGGLLPVATMLETLGFQKMVEETVTVERTTKVMSLYQFILAIVLGIYVGFSRLNQLRYIASDPLLAGILSLEGLALAAAMYALAFSQFPAHGHRSADPVDSAAHARSRMGSGQYRTERGYDRHRHHGAHHLR